jgi:hypothetical protein
MCLYYRGLCCSWRCLYQRGLSCIWTCVCTTEVCAAPGVVYTTGAGFKLHLDVSALQRPLPLLDVYKVTPLGPELLLGMSAQQRCVLLLDVSRVTPWGPSCIWTCLHYRGVCCSWMFLELHPGAQAASGHVCTTEVFAAPGCF